MNVLVLLAIILCLFMLLIGGRKGIKSFVSLFLNFIIFLFALFLMTDPLINPIILTIFTSTLVGSVNLFYINGINKKTKAAFISTVITIILLLVFIYVFTQKTMIKGFGEEEIDELINVYTLYLGVDFAKISTAVIIMSTVGAIIDVSISITSPMQEIYYQHPNIDKKELFLSGLTIGKDILGSNTNTLFFAFIGGYLALFLWFKDLSYSLGEVINSKIFSAEMITIFSAGIGIALIIPITSSISTFYLKRDKK